MLVSLNVDFSRSMTFIVYPVVVHVPLILNRRDWLGPTLFLKLVRIN
jgi:hypothetical protein